MAKEVRYTRGAGGKFTGSTGGGSFALTGANKAGGKRAIVARMRLRAQERRLKNNATLAGEVKVEQRGKERAKSLERLGKIRERLQRNIELHRREVGRVERSGGTQVKAELRRVANPANSRTTLRGLKTFSGKRTAYLPRPEASGKRDAATIVRARESHARDAEGRLRYAESILAKIRASGKNAIVERGALFSRNKVERAIATRKRALANRLKALAKARRAAG